MEYVAIDYDYFLNLVKENKEESIFFTENYVEFDPSDKNMEKLVKLEKEGLKGWFNFNTFFICGDNKYKLSVLSEFNYEKNEDGIVVCKTYALEESNIILTKNNKYICRLVSWGEDGYISNKSLLSEIEDIINNICNEDEKLIDIAYRKFLPTPKK